MKKYTTVCVFILTLFHWAQAQSPSGEWKGTLQLPGTSLELFISLQETDAGWGGKMDIPAQQARGIKLDRILFQPPMVFFEINSLQVTYEGILAENRIQGNFKQMGMEFPLDFVPNDQAQEVAEVRRPQTPQPPFSYQIQELKLPTTLGNTLAGTLTRPQTTDAVPLIILLHGSGPNNRDQSLFGHAPFHVLAHRLTEAGFAVFRFDKRGVGESDGNFQSAVLSDFMDDARSLVRAFRQQMGDSFSQIGIWGHSEGGTISHALAAEPGLVDFQVSMAGAAVPGVDMMLRQTAEVSRTAGLSFEQVEEAVKRNEAVYALMVAERSTDEVAQDIKTLMEEIAANLPLPEAQRQAQAKALTEAYQSALNPYLRSLLRFDPQPFIARLEVPTLILLGGKDVQVVGMQQVRAIEEKFADKKNLTVKFYPELNHLMQRAETGGVNEYASIEETLNEAMLADALEWLLALPSL
ncbi:MAG: alpha/beta hydrolase family protein [Nitritalea sp.]